MTSLEIQDAYTTPLTIFKDHRGSFARFFDFAESKSSSCSQISYACNTNSYTLRGMHSQSEPFSESKVISCISGSALDILVDLRPSSPTFRSVSTIQLDSEDPISIFVPRGVFHGYLTLQPNTTLLYLIDTPYQPSASIGFRYDDPLINHLWPCIPETISSRDKALPFINDL